MKLTFQKHHGSLCPVDGDTREKLDTFPDGAYYEVEIKTMDTRTIQQNKSIHKWCDQISNTLNKEKFFIQDVIKMNTQWSMIKVKEMIFKPVVKSLYTKDSTTKLKKDEFELVIDTICRYMAQKGVTLPEFPNKDRLEEIIKD